MPNSPITSLQTKVNELNANPTLQDDIRWKHFDEIIKAFYAYSKNSNVGPPRVEEQIQMDSVSEDASRILQILQSALPKSLKDKGIALMKYLTLMPHHYTISDQANLMKHGVPVTNSNFIDLLSYAVRTKKVKNTPIGWSDFYNWMLAVNTPKELMASHLSKVSQTPRRKRANTSPLNVSPKRMRLSSDSENEEDDFATPKVWSVVKQWSPK